MAGIVRRSFDEPDDVIEMTHGRSMIVNVAGEEIWRSELTAGWNWDEDLEPYAEGATSCPLTAMTTMSSMTRGELAKPQSGILTPVSAAASRDHSRLPFFSL